MAALSRRCLCHRQSRSSSWGSPCWLCLRPLRAGRRRWSVAVALGVACAVGHIVAALRRAYGRAAYAVAAVADRRSNVLLDVAAAVVVLRVGVIVGEVVCTYIAATESCTLLARRSSSQLVATTGLGSAVLVPEVPPKSESGSTADVNDGGPRGGTLPQTLSLAP